MSYGQADPRPRLRRRVLVVACALLGGGYAVAAAPSTQATFTDAGSAQPGTFSVGTLDITLTTTAGSSQGSPVPLGMPALTVTGLYPGGPTAYAEVGVTNAGSLPASVTLRFTPLTTAGGTADAGATALASATTVTVIALSGASTCTAAYVAANPGTSATVPTAGFTGDVMAVGTTRRWCVAVTMTAATVPPAAAQGASMLLSLDFAASQT